MVGLQLKHLFLEDLSVIKPFFRKLRTFSIFQDATAKQLKKKFQNMFD